MYRLLRCKNLALAMAFMAAMSLSTVAAHAQLIDELEANVPFAFSADNTHLPAGQYFIRPAQDLGTDVLEIENANRTVSVFVLSENSQFTQPPKASELTFDKVGNSYFLRSITVRDSLVGYTFMTSKAEAKMEKGNIKPEKHKLAINHHKAMAHKS